MSFGVKKEEAKEGGEAEYKEEKCLHEDSHESLCRSFREIRYQKERKGILIRKEEANLISIYRWHDFVYRIYE